MALNGFMDFFSKGKVNYIKTNIILKFINLFYFQTFKPKKRFTHGTIRYSLHKQAQASLESGINLRQAVCLPTGENLNDWVAVHGT